MKKETFFDKLAKKAFYRADVQKSWRVHVQAFGPILEPAFAEDYQSRIHLTAALNHVSRGEVRKGLAQLQKLETACRNDADRAAWLFFMGLVFEISGANEDMFDYYQQAAQCGHRFYLPYMKMAKLCHADSLYESAAEKYRTAIECLEESVLDDRSRAVLLAAHANLATCLIMMHRSDEAQLELNAAERVLPGQPGVMATQAILYATQGDRPKATALLERLKAEGPALFEETHGVCEDILSGRHPHFFPVPIDEKRIADFWDWFVERQDELAGMLSRGENDEALVMLNRTLGLLSPAIDADTTPGILVGNGEFRVDLSDYFMVSLNRIYEALLAARPTGVKACWEFKIVH